MPNSWSKQAYVQGFDFCILLIKHAINMFERMDIADSIYEGVVEPSNKKLLENMPTVLFTSVYIEEQPPCQILTPR